MEKGEFYLILTELSKKSKSAVFYLIKNITTSLVPIQFKQISKTERVPARDSFDNKVKFYFST